MCDLTKYFNSHPIHNSDCNNIYDSLLMLTNNKQYKILSFRHEQTIDISDYVLMSDENGDKYIDIPIYRTSDAINNYYTDKDIKIELVIKGLSSSIDFYKKHIDSFPQLSEFISSQNTYHLSIINKKIPINKSDYIFLVINYRSQIYIRLTFNRDTFNYNSFKFGYTEYVADSEIRSGLVPKNGINYYSGNIKYSHIGNNIGDISSLY